MWNIAKRLKTIKKDHHVIDGIMPLLEQVAELPGVQRVIPGVIFPKPNPNKKPFIRVQRETSSGLKLLAHNNECIQEVFLVVAKDKRENVGDAIERVA